MASSASPGHDTGGTGCLETFADFEVAAMPGRGQSGGEGTTTVITGDTEAEVSPTGKWIQPTD